MDPRNAERLHVLTIDLRERRVARLPWFPAGDGPVAVCGDGVRARRGRLRARRRRDRCEGHGPPIAHGRHPRLTKSTAMNRHLPWLNRMTLSAQRVAWPISIATQMCSGCSVDTCWMTKQIPRGTSTCDTIEMY